MYKDMAMNTIKGEDLSFIAHDNEYKDKTSLEWQVLRIKDYDKQNVFEVLGFKKVIDDHPEIRSMHVDFGSGAGWLLIKTAPYFTRVVGIEPSQSAVETAKFFTKSMSNVEHLNMGMFEGLNSINLETPTLFTTSTVFAHINDRTVKDFLHKLCDKAPLGSILFFGEPYGRNRQQHLWHIRSREWWANALPGWELKFEEYVTNVYKQGISGVFVGVGRVKNEYKMTIIEKIIWVVSVVPSRLKFLARKTVDFFSK